ncbi:MAG: aminopeptidase, partial [Oscillospiraceae bacterium]
MSEIEKTAGELLKEQLIFNPENAGSLMADSEIKEAYNFCEAYKTFLNNGKTERDTVKYTIELIKAKGYKPFDRKVKYKAGDKIYYNNRDRAIIVATVGKRSFEDGVTILAAHIDSPRVDLKQRPLYEEAQIAMFKTQYYGGIKKYQWTAIPLALHGVVYKADGTMVEVNIGEDDNDPVFVINDLLPHLSKEQNKRSLSGGIEGEELNIFVGCMPFKDDKVSEKVKLNIMNMLNIKYGIIEADLRCAELCAVPAGKARDVGMDRGAVGAYGQDDHVCAYTALMAELNQTETPDYTNIVVLADKEEVGSDSNTGLNSAFMKFFIADLAAPYGIEVRTVLAASKCLSADVTNAHDPTFASVTEKNNTAYLNYGVAVMKYTGSGGKSSTNDSDARY